MKRFLVKLVFRVGAQRDGVQEFDEQYRTVRAADFGDAFIKARVIGRSEQDLNGQLAWEFVDVEDIFELDGKPDGEQLFSVTRHDDSASFSQFVRRKAVALQVKNLTFA